MAKKPESEPDFKFESEFDLEKIKAMAEVDVKPKFDIQDSELGIEKAKNIEIVGTYYDLTLPKEKAIGKNPVKAINVMYNGIEHYFIAESESFRIQLDAIRYKLKLPLNQIDGLKLTIWKTERYLNTPNFKGKAKVYSLKLRE